LCQTLLFQISDESNFISGRKLLDHQTSWTRRDQTIITNWTLGRCLESFTLEVCMWHKLLKHAKALTWYLK